jgi:putative oxidoreductase
MADWTAGRNSLLLDWRLLKRRETAQLARRIVGPSALPNSIGTASMNDPTRYLPVIGRAVIGGIFLMSGIGKIGAYAATTAAITAVGLPLAPLGWLIALIVEIGFGLMLLLGFHARLAAAALAFWCVVTAVFFHSNWADQNMMIHFLKNLAIAGGLLQIVHFGAGALSVDTRKVAPLAATSA